MYGYQDSVAFLSAKVYNQKALGKLPMSLHCYCTWPEHIQLFWGISTLCWAPFSYYLAATPGLRAYETLVLALLNFILEIKPMDTAIPERDLSR